jgi:hypothetical protein
LQLPFGVVVFGQTEHTIELMLLSVVISDYSREVTDKLAKVAF